MRVFSLIVFPSPFFSTHWNWPCPISNFRVWFALPPIGTDTLSVLSIFSLFVQHHSGSWQDSPKPRLQGFHFHSSHFSAILPFFSHKIQPNAEKEVLRSLYYRGYRPPQQAKGNGSDPWTTRDSHWQEVTQADVIPISSFGVTNPMKLTVDSCLLSLVPCPEQWPGGFRVVYGASKQGRLPWLLPGYQEPRCARDGQGIKNTRAKGSLFGSVVLMSLCLCLALRFVCLFLLHVSALIRVVAQKRDTFFQRMK